MKEISFEIPDFKDGDVVSLSQAVKNDNRDRRRKLPNSDLSAIDTIPAGTKFRVTVTETDEEVGGLRIRRSDYEFQGERGTPYQYTTVRAVRRRVGDNEARTFVAGHYTRGWEEDFVATVVRHLVTSEDPVAVFQEAYPDLGWEVVRILAGNHNISSRTIQTALNLARAEKKS